MCYASPVAQLGKNCLQCRKHGFDPGSGRCSGEENGNPIQPSCLETSMDREVWQVTVHGITKSQI